MLIEGKIPFKYIVRQIRFDVARVLLFSICFQLLEFFFADYLPPIPGQLPTILGSTISLILAFKINQSYDRWWEARKIWGAIVNDSRSFTLQLRAFMDDEVLSSEAGHTAFKKLVYRQIAWCYSLGQSLRGLDPLENMTQFLTRQDIAQLQRHNNKPLAILDLHTRDIKELRQQQVINAYEHVQLDSTLVRFCDSMGKAERINSTAFPVTYRLLVHIFIYLFLVALSLSLVETIGLVEVPILLAFASTFFLLEKTATYLQDPFRNKPTDTPMTAVARTIEINLKQLLEESNVPKPLAADTFYLM
jgi:putative membrane protein